MKTVEGYWQDFYEFSGKASDINRQLAFAAIAVIWLFKTDTPNGQITIPHDLIWPGILIVAALAADLLQYVAGSLIWGSYARYLERRHRAP
jgi:thiamine transporter ThiT